MCWAYLVPPRRRVGSSVKAVTVACFVCERPLRVLDLTSLPPIPNFWDKGDHHLRHGICFLYDFVHELVKPIKHDGREHIEYVPTQIVTEFFRHHFSERLDGLVYKSTKTKDSRACVLFLTQAECGGEVGLLAGTHVLRLRDFKRFEEHEITSTS